MRSAVRAEYRFMNFARVGSTQMASSTERLLNAAFPTSRPASAAYPAIDPVDGGGLSLPSSRSTASDVSDVSAGELFDDPPGSSLRTWWMWALIAGGVGLLGGVITLVAMLNRDTAKEKDRTTTYWVSGGVVLALFTCVFGISKVLGAW